MIVPNLDEDDMFIRDFFFSQRKRLRYNLSIVLDNDCLPNRLNIKSIIFMRGDDL